MRLLNRDKQTIYYATYTRLEDIVDDYGNITGEHKIVYGNPVKAEMSVSAASGSVKASYFGADINYDKTLMFRNGDYAIDEYSVLWVDTMPTIKADGSTDTPYDYTVKKVAKSLNITSVAIGKIK